MYDIPVETRQHLRTQAQLHAIRAEESTRAEAVNVADHRDIRQELEAFSEALHRWANSPEGQRRMAEIDEQVWNKRSTL